MNRGEPHVPQLVFQILLPKTELGVNLPIFWVEESICEVSKSIWLKMGGEWPKNKEKCIFGPLEFQIMTPGGPNMAILGSNCPFSGVRDPFVRFPRASDPNWVENGRKRGKMHFRPNCPPPWNSKLWPQGPNMAILGSNYPFSRVRNPFMRFPRQ